MSPVRAEPAGLDLAALEPELRGELEHLCRLVAEAGGTAYIVGGGVRDLLLGLVPAELDVEVFGMPLEQLRRTLAQRWRLAEVGEAFAVLKLRGVAIDVSVPRRERAFGPGHRDFEIEEAPDLDVAEAARRRDFTINAMLWEPRTGQLFDPCGGRADLSARRLRHTSPRFSEDPLRVLRGMQLCARFDLTPTAETLALCRELDPGGLPRERLFEEWRKLLLAGRRISLGLRFLEESGWLAFFPELAALVGCEQDPRWHPEGDVWVHTGHVLDAFAKERIGDEREDLVVGFACLCHDLGKPATTEEEGGRVRSRGHEAAGEAPTRSFLARLTVQTSLVEAVVPLVLHHLKPRQLFDAASSDSAVRRLAQKVGRIDRLVRVARADAHGRPPLPDDEDPAGEWLMGRARALELADQRPRPLVLGRHLVARGLAPGPAFGPLLEQCFQAQLDGAFDDLEGGLAYLDGVLRKERRSPQSTQRRGPRG